MSWFLAIPSFFSISSFLIGKKLGCCRDHHLKLQGLKHSLYRQVATSIPWSIQQFQFCSGWSLWHYWLLQPVTSSKVNVWCEKMVFKVHATSQWNSEFTDSCTIMFSRPCGGGGADGHYWILVFILSMLYWDMAYIFYNLLCAAIFKSPYKSLVQLKLAQYLL